MSVEPLPLTGWRVEAAAIPPAGTVFRRVVDDAATLAALARFLEVESISDVLFEVRLAPSGREGMQVSGFVKARVVQACVVTLDPVDSVIDEPIDLVFVPPEDIKEPEDEDEEADMSESDPPEPLVDGGADLALVAIEFIALGIDPYPRKEGAVFVPPPEPEDEGPFAALKALRKDDGK